MELPFARLLIAVVEGILPPPELPVKGSVTRGPRILFRRTDPGLTAPASTTQRDENKPIAKARYFFMDFPGQII
jgi:hypothetical protein